ncbi:hypothetical protein [Nocardia sp. NPDC052316]|uniref:hypothetical protein n=1 Tax=Nocardia sp. NPDC052316 TaxID=3364329 RepID=UPI0037C9C94E
MFDTPPLPAAIVALVSSRRLPEPLSECFDSSAPPPDWRMLLEMVRLYLENPALDRELRGAVALLGAYAYLRTCEYLLFDLVERSNRAIELLQEAERHGIGEDDIEPLRAAAFAILEVASATEAQRDERLRPG